MQWKESQYDSGNAVPVTGELRVVGLSSFVVWERNGSYDYYSWISHQFNCHLFTFTAADGGNLVLDTVYLIPCHDHSFRLGLDSYCLDLLWSVSKLSLFMGGGGVLVFRLYFRGAILIGSRTCFSILYERFSCRVELNSFSTDSSDDW